MIFIEARQVDVTMLLTIMLLKNVCMRCVTGRYIACKRLVNVYKFRVHVY